MEFDIDAGVLKDMMGETSQTTSTTARDPKRAEAKRQVATEEKIAKAKKKALDLDAKLLRNKKLELDVQMKNKRLESYGKTGKGTGGFGSMMGAVTGGDLLSKIIMKMVSQSKIMNVVFSTLNKAMGFLMDVILLPFLPAIAFGLINLFKAIMEFKVMWDTFAKGGVLGVISFGLKATWEGLLKWVEGVLKFLFDTESPQTKLLNLTIGLVDFISNISWFGIPSLKQLCDFLFGGGSLKNITMSLGAMIAENIPDWLMKLLQFIFGSAEKKMEMVMDIVPKIKTPDLSNVSSDASKAASSTVNNFNVGINSAIQDPAAFYSYIVGQLRQEQWRTT